MSPIRSIAQRVAEKFVLDAGWPIADVRRKTMPDRRSAARPVFSEGWRKQIPRCPTSSAQLWPGGAKNKIEIWVASADGIFRAKSCLQVLTQTDWTSLLRIQHPANRNSAIAARVLLRLGLSRATGRRIAPAQWKFTVNEQQRPVVAAGLPQIRYSVSHVDDLVVVAISPTLEVGIDIESVDQKVSAAVMADFCHSDERHSADRLPDCQKTREFIRVWTLKEAYTKLRGVGHALDFRTLNFRLDPDRLASEGATQGTEPIHFENFYVSFDHALFHAAVAIERPEPRSGDVEIGIISLVDRAGRFACIAPSLA